MSHAVGPVSKCTLPWGPKVPPLLVSMWVYCFSIDVEPVPKSPCLSKPLPKRRPRHVSVPWPVPP